MFTAWGLRGPELTRSADPVATVAARKALHAVAGHSEGPRSPEVFIANQSAVAITVYRLLTEARSGDAIFFLCDSGGGRMADHRAGSAGRGLIPRSGAH